MMYEAIGLACIVLSAAALVVSVILVLVRVLGLRRRIVALVAAHPTLDPQWRARRLAAISGLARSARTLVQSAASLRASSVRIGTSLAALALITLGPAGEIERLLDDTLPWLRGLFR